MRERESRGKISGEEGGRNGSRIEASFRGKRGTGGKKGGEGRGRGRERMDVDAGRWVGAGEDGEGCGGGGGATATAALP